MKEHEIDKRSYNFRNMVIEVCNGCGRQHRVYTQPDDNPEYYTKVSHICVCGEVVTFNLPVN